MRTGANHLLEIVIGRPPRGHFGSSTLRGPHMQRHLVRLLPSTPRIRHVIVMTVAMVAVGVGWGMLPASAHNDEGVLSVVSAVPGPSSSDVTVLLTYTGDGHPVDGATVTAVADDAAGGAIDPVVMGPGPDPGTYRATVGLPSAGTWTVRVTAVSPSATTTFTQDVVGAPATTGAPSTAEPAETPSTSTTVTDDRAASTVDRASSAGWALPVIVAVVVVLAAVVTLGLRRRRAGGGS